MSFLSRFKLKSLKKKAKYWFDKRERGDSFDVNKEIKTLLELAKCYEKNRYSKKVPNANILALETLRAAASLGSAEGQYLFAVKQFENGRFWESLAGTFYDADMHRNYAKQAFDEGHTYLDKAIGQSYPMAKRLKGVAYIHGYGVPVNENQGFDLIIASINDENAWERAPEIIKELGLNNPKFFNSIMSRRK